MITLVKVKVLFFKEGNYSDWCPKNDGLFWAPETPNVVEFKVAPVKYSGNMDVGQLFPGTPVWQFQEDAAAVEFEIIDEFVDEMASVVAQDVAGSDMFTVLLGDDRRNLQGFIQKALNLADECGREDPHVVQYIHVFNGACIADGVEDVPDCYTESVGRLDLKKIHVVKGE